MDKIFVITGATSGIGYEMLKQLSANNRMVVIARDEDKLTQLHQEFRSIETYKANLADLTQLEDVADKIRRKHPSIDGLINNAAIQNSPVFLAHDFKYKDISKEVTTNFTSICCLTSLLLPSILNSEKGIILNINSGLALAPKSNSAIYCATKAALNSFTLSLRYQLEDTQISVQQAFLPLVDTKMTFGRGSGKLTSKEAAALILKGMKKGVLDHDIGKVKWLRLILRLAPTLAHRIMKKH